MHYPAIIAAAHRQGPTGRAPREPFPGVDEDGVPVGGERADSVGRPTQKPIDDTTFRVGNHPDNHNEALLDALQGVQQILVLVDDEVERLARAQLAAQVVAADKDDVDRGNSVVGKIPSDSFDPGDEFGRDLLAAAGIVLHRAESRSHLPEEPSRNSSAGEQVGRSPEIEDRFPDGGVGLHGSACKRRFLGK